MKKMTRVLALGLATMMLLALAACGGKDKVGDLTYAVEKGSAGEEIAVEKGYKYNAVASQADTLLEVNSGTSDAAIIDLLMAGAMIGEGTSYPDLTYTERLTEEEYGIGCRKGSDLTDYINEVLCEAYADGTIAALADQYGIAQDAVLEQPAPSGFTPAAGGDVAYIQGKGTLVVGVTDFAPMDYKNDAGQWIGFDADLAKAVAEKLGVKCEFVEIDWDNKLMELDGKTIDVVWNGMTLTDEVTNTMNCTNAYCANAQVVVVRAK